MRRVYILFVILVILAIIIAGYEFIINFSYTRHITLPPDMLASSTDLGGSSASSSPTGGMGSSTVDVMNISSPASSTVDTSSWLSYSDAAAGYSIRYPANLSVNMDGANDLILAFPKDQYFHWPLLDDAKVTVTASSSCPTVEGSDFPGNPAPVSFSVNGYTFNRIEGGDVAAGNIYRELAYDTQINGLCYHIDFLDHGANGATLYVGDQSLAAGYDDAHIVDLTAVLSVFNAMVGTFRLIGM